MLNHLITTFNITHSYFSSSITCSTLLKQFYSPFPRDCIFGSIGNAFSHKWTGCGFAHPPSPLLPQAIHMARLAAKHNPFDTPYKDTHVIIYVPPNTMQYHTPLTPSNVKQTHIEKLAIQILCIHHKNTIIGDFLGIQQINDYCPNIPLLTQITQPTPPNTKVQTHKTWHMLPNPPTITIHL
jgi:hypothetical protein